MGLESGTYIGDLITTNPLTSDPRSEGDDHFRLLKTVVQNTFPGFVGRFSRWQAKTGSYTALATDNWTLIEASGTLTLNLTAAATLGNGWSAVVYARAGDVTVDPNASEQVNGATTAFIPVGYAALIFCDGAKFLCVVASLQQPLIFSDGVSDPNLLYNFSLTTSVAGNALTIAAKTRAGLNASVNDPIAVSQRNGTITAGDYNIRKITAALSMVVSSGSTLGHSSGLMMPIYVYLIDNAGVQELAVSGTYQGLKGVYTTTTEGGVGGADLLSSMYSTTGRASVAGRLVAVLWSAQVTAGTWASNMSEIHLPPFEQGRIGEILDYAGGTVPFGYLLCDGSAVSRTGEAKLFGKISTTWGVGDGSTTFNVPDSRRRVTVGSGGAGTGVLGNALGNVGGVESVALTEAQMPKHFHRMRGPNSVTAPQADNGISVGVYGGGTPDDPAQDYGTYSAGDGAASGSQGTGTGDGSAHDNVQPSMIVTKMIRARGDM